MKLKIFTGSVCFLILMLSPNLIAGNVIIKGKSKDYAGRTIRFCTYTNFISHDEKVLASDTAGPQGNFSVEFSIPGTRYVFTHSGPYFLYLYVEPGKSYTIQLPPLIEKTPDEKLNPYFEEMKEHIPIVLCQDSTGKRVPDDLNVLISKFDQVFDTLYAGRSIHIYLDTPAQKIDSIVARLDSIFNGTSNFFFRNYCTYKIGMLEFMSSRFKSRRISNQYFLNKPVYYHNPAYMELFNQVYNKYLVYFGRTKTGKAIYTDINTDKSLSKVKSTLSTDQVLKNDTLMELVLLKGIHDGFYEMNFSRKALLQLLDSISAKSSIRIHREMAQDIYHKVTRLLPGYAPPAFRLLDQDSVWTSLSSFKGSMVYLIFCTTQNYACFKEYDQLKRFQQNHPNLLKIVTISVDESLRNIKRFTKKYPGYHWTFLYYGNQPEILKEYDIRTIPTYYLIGPDGKLIMSPAPSPSENFELRLFDYLRNEHKL